MGLSIERIIADKCIALLSDNRPYSRSKDLLDLWVINTLPYKINYGLLREYLLDGRSDDDIEGLTKNFPFQVDRLEQFERAYNSSELHNTYNSKHMQNAPSFNAVMRVFEHYCAMLFSKVETNGIFIHIDSYDYQIHELLPMAIKGYEEQFVLVGYIPFNYSGMAVDGARIPELMIPKTLRKKSIRLCNFVSYYPSDNVDPMAYTTEFSLCKGVRFPTKERAIIDYIRLDEECYCPDYFADSFSRYLIDKVADDESLDELREVARYFGVSWDIVSEYIRDYWGYNFDGDNTGWEEVAAR